MLLEDKYKILILIVLYFIGGALFDNLMKRYDEFKSYPHCFHGDTYSKACVTCMRLGEGINTGSLIDGDGRAITWDSIEGQQVSRQCRIYKSQMIKYNAIKRNKQ